MRAVETLQMFVIDLNSINKQKRIATQQKSTGPCTPQPPSIRSLIWSMQLLKKENYSV